MKTDRNTEHAQVVVIGGGQAGLSVGYCLARAGLSSVILDANARIGDSWRQRWDSLRLFTPARFDGLIGMPFPASSTTFPTKDEMAGYLESYARRFDLPVRTSVRVDHLTREGSQYVVSAGDRRYIADHVVVAMASYQTPRVPRFASELDPGIVQMHSKDYRNPSQLKPGGVLLVGAGNSGADIAIELSRTHQTWLAGRSTGQVPFRIDGRVARLILPFLFRVVFHRIMSVKTPIGRRIRPNAMSKGTLLIRVKAADLEAAGVERTPRVEGIKDGRPLLADGRILDVANVIWCTGFDGGFSWIDLPVIAADGEPMHESGIVTSEPGLYFVGLHFLHAMSSTMIHGVERDARRIVDAIAARVRAASLALATADSASRAQQPAAVGAQN
jgi:putative flavoprotein involved in K+ transport